MTGYEVMGSHERGHGQKHEQRQEQTQEGERYDWIPLMDYAMKTGISLSTLRRQIKAKKIQYKIENGRYLLLDSQPDISALSTVPVLPVAVVQPPLSTNADLQKAQSDLLRAREEIAELKTLIAFYEEKMFSSRPDGQA